MLPDLLNGLIGIVVLVSLAWKLYRPRVQQSDRYQAMIVPLTNTMDVGLGIWYNIRHDEPLIGTGDRTEAVASSANWSLLGSLIRRGVRSDRAEIG